MTRYGGCPELGNEIAIELVSSEQIEPVLEKPGPAIHIGLRTRETAATSKSQRDSSVVNCFLPAAVRR